MRFVVLMALLAGPFFAHADAQVSPECQALLEKLEATVPTPGVQAQLIQRKRDLENAMDLDALAHGHLMRDAQSGNVVKYERILFQLVGGSVNSSNEILAILRPVAYKVWDSYDALTSLATAMKAIMDRKDLNQDMVAKWRKLQQDYVVQSQEFGVNYGFYVSAMALIQSVADGKGSPGFAQVGAAKPAPPEVKAEVMAAVNADADAKDAPKPVQTTQAPEYYPVFDMRAPETIAVAKKVISILNPALEHRWFAGDHNGRALPSIDLVRTMFTHNIYALIAKLENDLNNQKAKEKWWRSVLGAFADIWLNTTDRVIPTFPGSAMVRDVLVRLAGIQYDNLMLKRYLDKIQEVVLISRVATTDGQIVLLTDNAKMEKQVTKLIEFSANATGNDFLATFARLSYHAAAWANLMRFVKDKSTATSGYSTVYAELYERMQDAEKRRKSLGYLPYLTDVGSTDYMIYIGAEAATALGIEEYATGGFLTHHGLQLIHSLLGI